MPSANVTFTSTGTASIGTDEYSNDVANYFPPVYAGDTYSINVSPELTFNENENASDFTITDFSVSSSTYFTYTDNGLSITIESGDDSPFSDYFQFLMPGNNLQILSPADARAQNFLAIIKWNPPTDSSVQVTHTFTIEYTEISTSQTSTANINMYQNLYFKYEPYINLVKALVEEGSL